jgi:hypothetical protein
MACEGTFVEYNKQSSGMPETGYRLNFSPPPGAFTHEFCGSNAVPGAQCPNCEKPLLKLASFSASDSALILDPARFATLPLLYCWTCALPYGEFQYKIHPDGSVGILKYLESCDGAFGPDGPYDGYTGEFRAIAFNLERQSDEEQRLLRLRFEGTEDDLPGELADPRHQVGGFPMIYNPQTDICSQCGAEMPMFATIADCALGNGDAKDPEDSFVDNSGVQTVFSFCRNCSVVSAYHSCD